MIMNRIELLDMLKKFGIEYAKTAPESVVRNIHMNSLSVNQKVAKELTDAVIVDFINFVAIKQGIDYALYTLDIA